MSCGYSLEAPRWGASNEYHNMFSLRNKQNRDTFWLKKAPYQELSDDSHDMPSFVFLEKMYFILLFAAAVIGPLRDTCHIVLSDNSWVMRIAKIFAVYNKYIIYLILSW